MKRAGRTSESAEIAKAAAWSSISWDTPSPQRMHPAVGFDDRLVDRCDLTEFDSTRRGLHPADIDAPTRAADSVALRRVHHWCAWLSRPTFGQIHGASPMETMRIASASVSEAADVLACAAEIGWGRGRCAGHLDLGPFRSHPTELGRPWVADAVVRGHRIRRLRVTVAIFRFGDERCGIQVRPKFRRPRSARRLRQRLRSTHDAADRLRELVLTVDFMPPRLALDVALPT